MSRKTFDRSWVSQATEQVGKNPENSDWYNPEGSVFKTVWFVVVTADGRKNRHEHNFETREDAEKFLSRVDDAGTFDPFWWFDIAPEYWDVMKYA